MGRSTTDWKYSELEKRIEELEARGLSRSFEDVVKENKYLQAQLDAAYKEVEIQCRKKGELQTKLDAALEILGSVKAGEDNE